MLQQLPVHGGPQVAELQRCYHIPHAQPALGELLISTLQVVREVTNKIKAELERSDSFHSTLAMTWHVSQLVLWVSKHIYYLLSLHIRVYNCIWLIDLYFLSFRDPQQYWILMSYESATNVRQRSANWGRWALFHIILFQILRIKEQQCPIFSCRYPPINWHRINGMFNRTMTFREDSDVVVRSVEL